MAAMLDAEPWHVIGASDGNTVMDLVQGDTADLVLIESEIPGLDGLEVTRRIRRDSEHRLLPIVLITACNDTAHRVEAINAGADDLLQKPLQRDEVVARVRSMLRLKTTRDRLEHVRQVIFALAKAAEAKDKFTLEHAERVADAAADLARRMGMTREAVQQIHAGALIHDVGKLAVPDHILNKPGPLTPAEFDVVKTHPLIGAEIVLPLMAQRHLYAIVRSHHERFDGKGYPDGLRGDAIPIAARLVAICDAYDAMVNKRAYREAMSHQTAIANLLSGRGSQWDPAAVDAFVAMHENR